MALSSVDALLPQHVAREAHAFVPAAVDRPVRQLDDTADEEASTGNQPKSLERRLALFADEFSPSG